MDNRTQTGKSHFFDIIGRLIFAGLLILMTFPMPPVHAQAPSPSVNDTGGAVLIGSGDFTAYKNPPHNSIQVGDSIEQALTGNLITGTDASGNECTLDPNKPSPVWSWPSTTTYSSDNTNYGASDSQITITGGQNATLFATFASQGYYRITYHVHVDFYTNCSSGEQSLDGPTYTETFSVNGRDFDFSVTDVGINQGESGTFISKLTAINGFSGPINFTNSAVSDPLFSVSGSGALPPPPGTAPITIGVGSAAIVGGPPYIISVRGTGTFGNTTLFHDHTVNVTILKREAWITYGQTFYNDGSNKQKINFEGPGPFTGQADTVYTTNPMVFSAHYNGFWNQNSTYNWGGDTAAQSGTFNPGVISTQSGFTPAPTGATTKSVTLSLIDGTHRADADYTVHYHLPVEVWHEDTAALITHPTPTNGPTDPNVSGEWNRVGPYPNNGPAGSGDAKTTFTESNDQEATIKATIGAEQGLTIDGKILQAAFKLNESVEVGQTFKTGVVQSYEVVVPPGYNVWVFWGVGKDEHHGTCDYYDPYGYKGTYGWVCTIPQGGPTANGAVSGQAAIRFAKLAKPLR